MQLAFLTVASTQPQARLRKHRPNKKPVIRPTLYLVQDGQKSLHQYLEDNYDLLRLEIERWRDILAVPYSQYKSKEILT